MLLNFVDFVERTMAWCHTHSHSRTPTATYRSHHTCYTHVVYRTERREDRGLGRGRSPAQVLVFIWHD